MIDLRHGDCLEVMRSMDAESVDAIVCDPPYGLEFMGKDWDHGCPGVHFWQEAVRVAKPGAHLLAFGGTRTFHRLACAIEDAGWEVRDCVMWVHGQGFPKSHDVSKAIDKAAGAKRTEVVGTRHRNVKPFDDANGWNANNTTGDFAYTAPATDAAKKWSGWGTALKPAVEYVICAQKPLTLQGLCGILAHKIGGAICQLPSLVKGAASSSASNPNEQSEGVDSALWSAVEKCNTPEDLFALMGTLQYGSEIPLTLSIGLSWLNILGAVSQAARMFTTETETGLITDLRTLNSLSSTTIAESIIGAATGQRGTGSSVSLAESIFTVVVAKLDSILTHSAPGLATYPDVTPGLHPNWRPIILARKPPCGTVAENVLKYGTGAINVDGCRVATNDCLNGGTFGGIFGNGKPTIDKPIGTGRWPANLIHDGSEEVLALFPQSKDGVAVKHRGVSSNGVTGWGKRPPGTPDVGYGSSGSAARFFYCAKASKSDRDEGCEGMEEQEKRYRATANGTGETSKGMDRFTTKSRNHHPTVKPTALMRYLCRLVTPPGGTVLDPFAGSGSTGKAAVLEGFSFIGIEKEAEYIEIAKARIAEVQRQEVLAL